MAGECRSVAAIPGDREGLVSTVWWDFFAVWNLIKVLMAYSVRNWPEAVTCCVWGLTNIVLSLAWDRWGRRS